MSITRERELILQPIAPTQESGGWDLFLEGILGVDMEYAYSFCILKYLARLKYGDSEDYKVVEEEVMREYLSFCPDLQTLWMDRTTNPGLQI